jgi:hypothetical protein
MSGLVLARSVYNLKVMFVEPILGSLPGKDTPASEFLTKKAIEKNPALASAIIEETGTLPEEVEKGTTVFHRDTDGMPILYSYVVKGVLKASAEALNGFVTGKKKMKKEEEVDETLSNFRSNIDKSVAVNPHRIRLITDKPIGFLERPLRAMTKQGPRVSLARSEMIEAGAFFECQVTCYEIPKFCATEEILRLLFDYSRDVKGFGQWHNSGIYGKFDYTLTKVE